MASKRKSTTPCMIPLKTLALDGSADVAEAKNSTETSEMPAATDLLNDPAEILSTGHENVDGLRYFCKYCNFGCQETGPFVEHMNATHPGFRDDPSYVCIACSFLVKDPQELESHNSDSHAGDSGLSWTVAKHERYTVVEQSVSAQDMDNDPEYSEMPVTKTPIMRSIKNRPDTKKIKDNCNTTAEEPERKVRPVTRNGPVTNHIVNSSPMVNGSIIGTVPMLQTGLTHLVSLNASQPIIQPKLPAGVIAAALPKQSAPKPSSLPSAKSLPKVMIPLSSIPTYNSSMDSNCFLKNSFTKFPYPTKAELCYLTVVTKYPEEQIKIWFTAQRLKQGISWSPEEIEDSRKKMFNTIIQSIPQPMPQPTITVLNAPIVTSANGVQHLIQATLPGQIVGQPQGAGGIIVTQPIIANGIHGAAGSVSLAVAPLPTSQTAETEYYSAAENSPPSMSSSSFYDGGLGRSKKSRHQLNVLKNSFCKSRFPSHSEVARLTRLTGLATKDVRKWFSDRRYHYRNKPQSYLDAGDFADDVGVMDDDMKESVTDYVLAASGHALPMQSHTPRRHSWHQTPDFATTKYKERAPEQLRALEDSFAKNDVPTDDEVTRLRSETKMTRREIDGWFSEKRKRLSEELKREKARCEDEYNSDMDVSEAKPSIDAEGSLGENGSPVEERKVNPIKINLKALRVTDTGDHTHLKDDASVHSDASSRPPSRPPTPQRYRAFKKTPMQRDCLKQMFVKTQWPSSVQYDFLHKQTGLPRPEIVRWFGDSRYCYKIGNLKWYEGYKKIYGQVKPVTLQPLVDYYGQHRALDVGDVDTLCEQSGLSKEEVENWFADRREEEKGVVNDASNDLSNDAINYASNDVSNYASNDASHDVSNYVGNDTQDGIEIQTAGEEKPSDVSEESEPKEPEQRNAESPPKEQPSVNPLETD